MDSVNLATSIVTGSPLLVLRVMVDKAYLFLSNKKETTCIDLQKGEVWSVGSGVWPVSSGVWPVSKYMCTVLHLHVCVTYTYVCICWCVYVYVHVCVCVSMCACMFVCRYPAHTYFTTSWWGVSKHWVRCSLRYEWVCPLWASIKYQQSERFFFLGGGGGGERE